MNFDDHRNFRGLPPSDHRQLLAPADGPKVPIGVGLAIVILFSVAIWALVLL